MSARELLVEHDKPFVAFARTIASSQWEQASLCSDWSAHEVLAHLVIGCGMALHSFASVMLAHGGNFHRANARAAQDLAAQQTPGELIDSFEALIEHPKGIGKLFPSRLLLGDHVLHHLDIALALGRQPEIPGHIVNAVLDTEVRIPNPFVPAKRNAAGLTLHATDTGWRFTSRGDTRYLVEGKAIHLAEALAGRQYALAVLTGGGVAQLHERMPRSAHST